MVVRNRLAGPGRFEQAFPNREKATMTNSDSASVAGGLKRSNPSINYDNKAEDPTGRWLRAASFLAFCIYEDCISTRALAVALEREGLLQTLDLDVPAERPEWFLRLKSATCDWRPWGDHALPEELHLAPELPKTAVNLILLGRPVRKCVEAFLEAGNPDFLALFGRDTRNKIQDDDRYRLARAYDCQCYVGNRLRKAMVGQSEAVEALAGLAFDVQLRGQGTGACPTALFMGPPGVGKTLGARLFAQEMAAWEEGANTPFSVMEVEMGQYAQWASAAEFWDTTKPGTIVSQILKCPRTVFLLDEFEKAHVKVLESLLPALSDGLLTLSGKQVDFRQAIFLFASNLGEEYWDRPSNPEEGAFTLDPADLLKLAQTRNEDSSWYKTPIPAPLLSRLAQGRVVLFRRHLGHHLLEKVIRGSKAPIDGVLMGPRNFYHAGFRFAVDREAIQALVLTHLVGRDLRSADQMVNRFLRTLLCQAQEQLGAKFCGVGELAFKVVADQGLRAQLSKSLQESGFAARLVTGVAQVQQLVRKHLPCDSGEVVVAARVDALGALPSGTLVIVDHLTEQVPGSPRLKGADHLVQRTLVGPTLFAALDEPAKREAIPMTLRPRRGLDQQVEAADRLAEGLNMARFSRFFERSRSLGQRWRSHLELSFQPNTWCVEAVLKFDGVDRVLQAQDLKRDLTWVEIPKLRLADVLGMEPAKAQLREYLAWLNDPSAEPGLRGCILSGPSGTGKTHACLATAGEGQLPAILLSGSEFRTKYYGETERLIRETIESLRNVDAAVLLIDEVDSLAWRRDQSNEWSAEYQASIVGQLLHSIDLLAKGPGRVLLLATTNQFERLEPALVRRIRDHLYVGLPGPEDRRLILGGLLQNSFPSLELDELVGMTTGMTPADLSSLVKKAHRLAEKDSEPVSLDHFRAGSLELRRGETDLGARLGETEKRRVAIHEAGHAVLAFHLLGPESLEHLSVVPTGSGTLGAVYARKSDSVEILDRPNFENHLAILLAGRAAECLLTKTGPSSGAGRDLHEATNLAHKAVSAWGLDPGFPLLALDALPERLQETLAPMLMERIQILIQGANLRAMDELVKHRRGLELLAHRLFEAETLHRPEVIAILAIPEPPSSAVVVDE